MSSPSADVLEVSPAGWAVTLVMIAGLLAFDLLVSSRQAGPVPMRVALAWSLAWVLVAVLFGAVLAVIGGGEAGTQYYAGFLVEKSLSLDNLFVFAIVLGAFAVPVGLQSRALMIGIALALALRGVLIAVGAALISAFTVMFLVFGLALLFTAVQLFRHREQDPVVDDNAVVALTRRFLPITNDYRGARVFDRVGGRLALTPLFIVLVAIATSDVLFALDSIPAVFGVTQDTYIVFTANAFALLGMRALYFLLAGLLDRLVFLSVGLAAVLAFIGVKLVLEFLHDEASEIPQIGTGVSLAVIAAVLAVTAVASVVRVRRDPTARAHAGALRDHARAGERTDEDARARRRPGSGRTARAARESSSGDRPQTP